MILLKKIVLDTIIKLSLKIKSRYLILKLHYLILKLLGSVIKIIRKSMVYKSFGKRLVV